MSVLNPLNGYITQKHLSAFPAHDLGCISLRVPNPYRSPTLTGRRQRKEKTTSPLLKSGEGVSSYTTGWIDKNVQSPRNGLGAFTRTLPFSPRARQSDQAAAHGRTDGGVINLSPSNITRVVPLFPGVAQIQSLVFFARARTPRTRTVRRGKSIDPLPWRSLGSPHKIATPSRLVAAAGLLCERTRQVTRFSSEGESWRIGQAFRKAVIREEDVSCTGKEGRHRSEGVVVGKQKTAVRQ